MGRSKTPPDYLSLCSIAAQKEGLSYGKYMAKYSYHPPCLDGLLDEIMNGKKKKAEPEYLKNMEKDFETRTIRKCRHCGKPFEPDSGNQFHCSRECSYEAARLREKKKALAGKEQRYCAVCGAELPLNISARILTCSKECSIERKKEYVRLKNRAQYQKRKQKAMAKGD